MMTKTIYVLLVKYAVFKYSMSERRNIYDSTVVRFYCWFDILKQSWQAIWKFPIHLHRGAINKNFSSVCSKIKLFDLRYPLIILCLYILNLTTISKNLKGFSKTESLWALLWAVVSLRVWVFGELEVPAQKAQTGGWRGDRRCLWPLDVVRWVHTCPHTDTKDSGYIRQRHTQPCLGHLDGILRDHRKTVIDFLVKFVCHVFKYFCCDEVTIVHLNIY